MVGQKVWYLFLRNAKGCRCTTLYDVTILNRSASISTTIKAALFPVPTVSVLLTLFHTRTGGQNFRTCSRMCYYIFTRSFCIIFYSYKWMKKCLELASLSQKDQILFKYSTFNYQRICQTFCQHRILHFKNYWLRRTSLPVNSFLRSSADFLYWQE